MISNNTTAAILFVDDEVNILNALRRELYEENFNKHFAFSAEEALEILEKKNISVIISDLNMPGMGGMELLKKVKVKYPDIIRIILTSHAEVSTILNAIHTGETHRFIKKPWNCEEELIPLIKQSIQLFQISRERKEFLEKLKRSNQLIKKQNQELRLVKQKLESLARKDPLTSLSNRRDIIEKIELEKVRFKRQQRPFALIMGDIDNFKTFNDNYGHDCGDLVLTTVAQAIELSIRAQDCVSRWGGEEFLLFLPETDLKGGIVLAEKIRKKIQDKTITFKGLGLSVTMTFGVSVFEKQEEIMNCINRADEGLYHGKKNGKNRVDAAPAISSNRG